jgi:hypothetical protein
MSKKSTEVDAPEVDATEVEGTPKRSKSEQLARYKERYEPYQAPNGSISMDNADDVALKLRGASPEVVMRAAEKLKGLEPGTLSTRYAERNPGAKRMNAGNIIRGCWKRGETTPAEISKALKAASGEINKAS